MFTQLIFTRQPHAAFFSPEFTAFCHPADSLRDLGLKTHTIRRAVLPTAEFSNDERVPPAL